MGCPDDALRIVEHPESTGPGNLLHVVLRHSEVTEVFTGFGMKNVPGKRIAAPLAGGVQRYLATPAPVGEHLADQLMLPLALLGGGRYRCTGLSSHARTHAELLNVFCGPGTVVLHEEESGTALVEVHSGGEVR